MPSRYALIQEVNNKLRDNRKWREYAFHALEIFEKKDPAIVIDFEDGSKTVIPFVDLYCQCDNPKRLNFEELIITAIAWQDILSSKLIYRAIQVQSPPAKDLNIEYNNAILKDMLNVYSDAYSIQRAEFWGGTQEADGSIVFGQPFIKNFVGISYDDELTLTIPSELNSGELTNGICKHFPLEVGYCLPHQINFHLTQTGCVARFPYYYDLIIFFERNF